eukprot:6484660-Pyramimonas_sp.AAC.1
MEYSQSSSFDWWPAWNILTRCRSIGLPRGIFLVIVVRLVARVEYSQSLSFDWSPTWNILSRCLLIGRPRGTSGAAAAPQRGRDAARLWQHETRPAREGAGTPSEAERISLVIHRKKRGGKIELSSDETA